MSARFVLGGSVGVLMMACVLPVSVGAQSPTAAPAPLAQISLRDAVRLAVERNQTLRAQRLTIDAAKADILSAGVRPNPTFSFTAAGLSAFSPSQLTFRTGSSDVAYDAGLTYTFERGSKRQNRLEVAQAQVDVAAKGVAEAERQVQFQTEQAFINVLLGKSTLDVTRQDLKTFSDFVDLNQQ